MSDGVTRLPERNGPRSEEPVTTVTQHQQVSGTLQAGSPVLIAKGAPTPAPAGAGTTTTTASAEPASTTASAQLPKTATRLPLVGFLGLFLMLTSLGMGLLRRSLGVRG